jgi:hypothetical protein
MNLRPPLASGAVATSHRGTPRADALRSPRSVCATGHPGAAAPSAADTLHVHDPYAEMLAMQQGGHRRHGGRGELKRVAPATPPGGHPPYSRHLLTRAPMLFRTLDGTAPQRRVGIGAKGSGWQAFRRHKEPRRPGRATGRTSPPREIWRHS